MQTYMKFLHLSIIYISFSASDGPDALAEELDIVKNMNLAIKEERYNDAGTFEGSLFSCLFLTKLFFIKLEFPGFTVIHYQLHE